MSSRGRRPVQEPDKRSLSDLIIRASVTVSVIAIAGLLVLLAVNATGNNTGSDAMAHIHGLGIDPADGQLVAATHYGAFEVDEDGDLEQVGPVQDLMGFTIVGPGHYLASGHPGADQEDQPSRLGLIESTDGGKSWRTMSLAGKADFHTLEARGDRVYGYSKARIMMSDDKQDWEDRAHASLADLAISPSDPDTLLIATEKGVSISTDGGQTVRALPDTPPLALVEWSSSGLAVGVDERGQVRTSTDEGATWEARGTVAAQPVAVAVDGDSVFIATRDGAVMQSNDGGEQFQVRYQRR